jgi:uncharacterized membrane protein
MEKRTERASEITSQSSQETQSASTCTYDQKPQTEAPVDGENQIELDANAETPLQETHKTSLGKAHSAPLKTTLPSLTKAFAPVQQQKEPVPEQVQKEYKRLKIVIAVLAVLLVISALFVSVVFTISILATLFTALFVGVGESQLFANLSPLMKAALISATLLVYLSIWMIAKKKNKQKKLRAQYPDLDPIKKAKDVALAAKREAARKTEKEKKHDTFNALASMFLALFILLACVFLTQGFIITPFWLLGSLTMAETTTLILGLVALFGSLGLWLIFRRKRNKLAL